MPRPDNAAALAAADVFALLAGLSGLRRAVEVAAVAAAQNAADDLRHPEETPLPEIVALVHRRPWW